MARCAECFGLQTKFFLGQINPLSIYVFFVQNGFFLHTKPSNKFKKVDHLVPMLSLSNAFHIFFQNISDKSYFINNRIIHKNNAIDLIPGSGIDIDYFYYNKKSYSNKIKFLVIFLFLFILFLFLFRDKILYSFTKNFI